MSVVDRTAGLGGALGVNSWRFPVPSDLAWIDEELDEWPCTLRWDVRGMSPSEPSLAGRLWDGVATQRVLLDQSGPPFGLLQLTSADLLNGSARLEALVRDAVDASGYAEDFVRRAFESFPLRVVHIFAVVDVFRSEVLVPSATEVGRLTELQFRGQGRYADVTIHEIRKPSAGA